MLIYLVQRIGLKNLTGLILSFSPKWIIVALICWAINLLIATFRLCFIASLKLPHTKVLKVIMVSYLLNYASMVQGLGIGVKIGMLKGHRVPVSRSLSGIGGEIFLDLFFTGLVTLLYFFLIKNQSSFFRILSPLFLYMMVAAVIVFIVLAVISAQISDFIRRILKDLRSSFALTRLPINFLLTTGVWISAASFYYCLIRAAGGMVPPLIPLVALSVGFIAGIISFIPGGLGIRDLTWAYICSTAGTSEIIAGTAALTMRVLGISSVALALIIWTLVERKGSQNKTSGWISLINPSNYRLDEIDSKGNSDEEHRC